MKHIKFRGKGYDGKWLYGDLKHTSNNTYSIIGFNLERRYIVQEETIGQYIGMKDYNGREIFDGDIIQSSKDGFSSKHEIIYVPEEAAFKARMIDSSIYDYCSLSKEWIEKFEKVVIGNIHDNPELLKQI